MCTVWSASINKVQFWRVFHLFAMKIIRKNKMVWIFFLQTNAQFSFKMRIYSCEWWIFLAGNFGNENVLSIGRNCDEKNTVYDGICHPFFQRFIVNWYFYARHNAVHDEFIKPHFIWNLYIHSGTMWFITPKKWRRFIWKSVYCFIDT